VVERIQDFPRVIEKDRCRPVGFQVKATGNQQSRAKRDGVACKLFDSMAANFDNYVT